MWTIVVRNPQEQEHCRTYLRPGVVATVGRAPDCTITLTAMTVSRQQGRIELRSGVPVYFDAPESTGTRINGSYVRGPTPLHETAVLEIAGYRFTAERTIAEKAAEAAPAPAKAPAEDWMKAAGGGDSLESMLAQRVQGIRQHRQQNSSDRDAAATRFLEEWQQLVQSARRLQQQLAGDPRILAFAVSRDDLEVLVKVKDHSARGYSSFILAQRHPQGKYAELRAAWLLQLGEQDAFFQSPRQAMEEFVHRFAPRLA